MMKRIVRMMFIICFIHACFGCGLFNKTTQDGSGNDSKYDSGATFSTFSYDPTSNVHETFFDVTFKEIEYIPVLKKINVWFTMNDPEGDYAQYYAVLQNSRQQSMQIIWFARANICEVNFSIPDPKEDYRIVIGKVDSENLNPTPGYVEGSAWIEWDDPYQDERKTIQLVSSNDSSPDVVNYENGSSVSASWIFNDTKMVIDSFTAVLYDTSGNYLKTKTIETRKQGSRSDLKITTTFENLAPNSLYKIQLYINGNDGVSDFTKVLVGSQDVQSADYLKKISESVDSTNYHQLFGSIYDVFFTDTEMMISYSYGNSYHFFDNEHNRYLELYLEVCDSQSNINNLIPLEIGNHQIVIPYLEIDPGDYIRITDQNKMYTYDIASLKPNPPVLLCSKVDTGNYNLHTIDDFDHFDNITSTVVDVYYKGTFQLIETIHLNNIYEYSQVVLSHQINNSACVRLVIKITFVHLGHEYTTLQEWIE